MARLHEFQGKKILSDSGIPVPKGAAAQNAQDVIKVAGRMVCFRFMKFLPAECQSN